MTKTIFQLTVIFFLAFVTSSLGAQQQSTKAAAANPTAQKNQNKPYNVLFISIDDLNDWIEPLGGHPQAKTPNLARLAKRGVCFTNAHCQAPICNPSRISLLTGMLPSSSGVYYLGPLLRDCESTKRAVSLPQHFANNGYVTMGVGKIFHTADKNEFGEYGGNFGGFGPRPGKPLVAGHTHPLWDWGAFPQADDQMPDAKIAAWTAGKLQQKHDKPFFLACGFYRPHVPMYVPQKWFDLYPLDEIQLPAHRDDDLQDVPEYGQDLSWSAVAPRHSWIVEHGEWKHAVQSYLACVSFVDAQVGKVLDALEASEHNDNTIVVLWSDHGFHLGTKQRWGKRSLWEKATRVVTMISVPGMSGDRKCDRPMGLIDFYPTLIELCDLPQMTGLEGHSLVPLLKDPGADWSWPAITTFGQYNHAIRSQDWRYIVYADGSEELYDHRQDAEEFQNLAAEEKYGSVITYHRQFLPQLNHPMAPGSHNADARPGSAADIDSALQP